MDRSAHMAEAQPDRRASRRLVVEPGPSFDLLRLHAAFPERYPVLLESAAGSAGLARYDVLFGFPEEKLDLGWDRHLTGRCAAGEQRFLSALDRWWSEMGGEDGPAELPFAGGWFLFLGYELAQEVEPSLRLPARPPLPVACALRVPVAVVRDRRAGRTWMVAEPQRAGRLRDIEHDLRIAAAAPADDDPALAGGLAVPESIVEDPPEEFLAAVLRARSHIAAGDVYQANLSRSWHAQLRDDVQPWMLYRQLRQTNPAPFAGLAMLEGIAVICSSPERLVHSREGVVNTRPIAGTRPRGGTGQDDAARRAELIASPKERAEHVMLIDLERSDLGRVCVPGSVRVSEFMSVESYAHVHHIVSNVTGRLRPGTMPGEIIRAVFPGGTITGCPKVRCMELIRDIERQPRGAYTGAMGYLNRDGSLDLNILIRTMAMQDRHVTFRAGSGIVADSDPERELAETRAKAMGLRLALEAPWIPGW